MKSRSLRGLCLGNETKPIILDDGRITKGYIIKEFHVWTTSISGSRDPAVSLGLDKDMNASWDARDNRQIAWAGMTTSASDRVMSFSLVDPNHLVVRDLYVKNFTNDPANYLIVIEPVTITEDEAVIAIIKERSQDDDR